MMVTARSSSPIMSVRATSPSRRRPFVLYALQAPASEPNAGIGMRSAHQLSKAQLPIRAPLFCSGWTAGLGERGDSGDCASGPLCSSTAALLQVVDPRVDALIHAECLARGCGQRLTGYVPEDRARSPWKATSARALASAWSTMGAARAPCQRRT
jgi:hypothetical protein